MAITSSQKNGDMVLRHATGAYLDDAGSPAAFTITLGFTPRYFIIVNATDRDQWEYFDGMASGYAYKRVAAGTGTLETSNCITVDASAGTVTIGSGIVEQNKQFYWRAM